LTPIDHTEVRVACFVEEHVAEAGKLQRALLRVQVAAPAFRSVLFVSGGSRHEQEDQC